MDDTKTIVYALDAEEEVSGWLKRHRPTLMVRCHERKTSAFIVTGMSSSVEYGKTDEHTVNVRFDDGAAQKQVWSDSTDDEALFSASPVLFAKRLAVSKRLRFGWTPFNASPVIAEFSVGGFDDAVAEIGKECRWSAGSTKSGTDIERDPPSMIHVVTTESDGLYHSGGCSAIVGTPVPTTLDKAVLNHKKCTVCNPPIVKNGAAVF